MAVQQSKRSRSRSGKKRSAWAKLTGPTLVSCPQCHEPKVPHRVCPECGFYNGKEVVKAVAE